MQGRYVQAASRAGQAGSFIRPEILAIPAAKMDSFSQDPALAPYRLLLTRIVRFKPHTLCEKEEKLLAMQTEMAEGVGRIFRQLHDTDMKFGTVKNEKGQPIELSHATFSRCLHSPRPAGSPGRRSSRITSSTPPTRTRWPPRSTPRCSGDVYYAKARNYPSSLEAALFPDQVPVAVYDNLLASIHRQLPALHEYYDVRRRKMGLTDIHHYDTYVPIVADLQPPHVGRGGRSGVGRLDPLGSEYCDVISKG